MNDGVIQMELNEGHRPTVDIIKKLRRELAVAFPDVMFYFQPADLVTQVLNFGVPTQIDVQIQGRDRENNKRVWRCCSRKWRRFPASSTRISSKSSMRPRCIYTVDRTRAQQLGLNMQDVANNLNISLSSSEQVSPNFWTDPKNGIPYFMPCKRPNIASPPKISSTTRRWRPACHPEGTPIPTVLGNLATSQRDRRAIRLQPFEHSGGLRRLRQRPNRDLGSMAAELHKIVAELEPQLKPGNHIVIRGQIESMVQPSTILRSGSCSPPSSSTC